MAKLLAEYRQLGNPKQLNRFLNGSGVLANRGEIADLCWPKMNIRSRISLKGKESLVGGGARSGESVTAPTPSKAMPLTLTMGE